MIQANENFLKLPNGYLFTEISNRYNSYKAQYPDADVIRLGVGDVTQPIAPVVIKAMHKAVDEMGNASTFRGYGPEEGYDFLRNAIAENDYKSRGINIHADEIFVSDGANCDLGNIGDVLGLDNVVAITDPVYPVYIDTNAMAGRAGEFNLGKWSKIVYLPCTKENGFIPELPTTKVDMIYLCYPNNPTGTSLTKEELKVWVDYAIDNNVLILFDSAYEAYIIEDKIPHSIYEIEGAEQVAIEFRSFSKTAGFTGLRCAYLVIPKTVYVYTQKEEKVTLHSLWFRRQTTKFNGVSYIVQRGAEACYSPEGKIQTKEAINYYLTNAKNIWEELTKQGLNVLGGINSPYLWVETPNGMTSWQFFDYMLTKLNVVITPGVGFGPNGEGYVRLTSFNTKENIIKAINRFKEISI